MALQAGREQYRCDDAVAEQALDRRRVVVLCDDLLPGFVQSHDRAAYAQRFEDERPQLVQCIIPRASGAAPR